VVLDASGMFYLMPALVLLSKWVISHSLAPSFNRHEIGHVLCEMLCTMHPVTPKAPDTYFWTLHTWSIMAIYTTFYRTSIHVRIWKFG
jgi:hypothetical protein